MLVSRRNILEKRDRRYGRLLLVACLAIDALVLGLVFSSDNDMVYARSVDQALAQAGRSPSMRLHVTGVLAGGSLEETAPCAWRFQLRPEPVAASDAGGPAPQLSVSYRSCRLPDTLCDFPNVDLRLHARGRLVTSNDSWSLEADHVMPSCPTKYSVSPSICEDAPDAARRRCGMCSAANEGAEPPR
jgi:hypothetical protein